MVKITESEEDKGQRPHGSTQEAGTSSSQPFQLSGTNLEFGSRSVDVFGGLETLEAKHEAYERVRSRSRDDDQQSLLKPDPVRDDELLGTSSRRQAPKRDIRDRDGFVRPQAQPRPGPRHHFHGKRPRMTSDHQRHPERWTRYDLSDVSNQDMSNRSNTSAALSFLSALKKPSASSTSTAVDDTVDDSSNAMVTDEDWEVKPGPSCTTLPNSSDNSSKAGSLDLEEPFKMRHSFRKPKTAAVKDTTTAAAETDSDKPKFVRGKYVMPEYEIGKVAEQKSSKKNTGAKSSKQTEKFPETLPKDVNIAPVDDDVEDVAGAAAEAKPVVAMETSSEITFKSRKKVNKRGIRQKHLEKDEEET